MSSVNTSLRSQIDTRNEYHTAHVSGTERQIVPQRGSS